MNEPPGRTSIWASWESKSGAERKFSLGSSSLPHGFSLSVCSSFHALTCRQDNPIKNVLLIFYKGHHPQPRDSLLTISGERMWLVQFVSVYRWAIQLYAGGFQLTGLWERLTQFQKQCLIWFSNQRQFRKIIIRDGESPGHLHTISKVPGQTCWIPDLTAVHSHLAARRNHWGSFTASWCLDPIPWASDGELVWEIAWSSAVWKAPLLNLMCKWGEIRRKDLEAVRWVSIPGDSYSQRT